MRAQEICHSGETRRGFTRAVPVVSMGRVVSIGFALAITMLANLAASDGAFAADETSAPMDAAATSADATPISLAGRWSGTRFSRGPTPASASPEKSCNGPGCTLVYDIVACPSGWCGIVVADDKTCGAIGLRIAADRKLDVRNAFTGKLELAKGADAYVVQVWYSSPGATAGEDEGKPRLSFIGDTGPELMMFRRSFPFQAELARIGDAACTPEKATS